MDAVRARRGALCTAVACALGTAAACGEDGSAQSSPDASLADAAHRGDTGPIGGPVRDADVICSSMGLLFDNFDELAAERWTVFRDPSDSSCSVEVVGGRLELASGDDTVACGLATASCHDMTDRAISIDAAEPGADGVPEPFLRLALKSGGVLEMRVTSGEPLSLELRHDDDVLSSEAFAPEQQRLWRIMHTEVAGRVDFQTSPPELTEWTTIASTDVGSGELTEVQVFVGALAPSAPDDLVAFDDVVGIDF